MRRRRKDGELFMRVELCHGRHYKLIVVKQALQGVHDEAAHQVQCRTLYLARQRLFWADTKRDVREYVKACKHCVVSKTLEPEGRAPLESIKNYNPAPTCRSTFGPQKIAMEKVWTCSWLQTISLRWPMLFAIIRQSRSHISSGTGIFCVYGFPKRIHSDQSANFGSELIPELLQVAGVKKYRTTAYHPMENGNIERFNQTFGSMIKTLPPRALALQLHFT